MIAIIDYGMGNLRSVQKALEFLNISSVIASNREEIKNSNGIIVPGVGAFPDAMENLKERGLDKVILEAVEEAKPILGICLGMQLFFENGEEVRNCEGLGIFKGTIKKITGPVKIPHIGWNNLYYEKECALLKGLKEESYFYFVHSYYADIEEDNILDAYCNYSERIPAVVSKKNVYGLQFHPEKSGDDGMKILKNFGGADKMIILPAMDIKDGRCVRLCQGEFSTVQVVGKIPMDTAKKLEKQGAEYLHMVDLDGALKGDVVNLDVICAIIKNVKMPVQLGGGIRSIETIETLINNGLSRVILGTAALKNPSLVKEAVRLYEDKIAVGIDAKNGYVAVEGWTNTSKTNYIEFGKRMEDIGVKTIIFTDISKDGTLSGPNFEATGELNNKVSCNIIASGGIKGIEDIRILSKMNIYGTIIGKAIYSGNIDLAEAIRIGVCRGDINAY